MNAPMAGKTGSVLVICLMVLAILGVLSLWAGKVASLNRKTAINHVRQLQSLYLAEAGIDLSLAAIRENPLWRGNDSSMAPSGKGTLDLKGATGFYAITIYDATDDGNGKWDSQLPGGILTLFSEGTFAEAYQSLSCRIKLFPSAEKTGSSPKIALISAGDITVAGGAPAPAGLDELGREDISMIRGNTDLPKIHQETLKAMADEAFSTLDDEAFDIRLSAHNAFWRDSPADTCPHITRVVGDMILSGNKTLYGIFFVEGDRVSLSGEVRLHGVLFAPNAHSVTIPGEDDTGSPSIMGQVIVGAGGVESAGGQMGVRLVGEYVDAFSDVAGASVEVSLIPGSWHRP
ncbi:MAG: hypothetical protein V2B19_33245 [Pseudomonadota bacterium]